jgi:hypothetical protein
MSRSILLPEINKKHLDKEMKMMSIPLNIPWPTLMLPLLLAASVFAAPLTGFAADLNNEAPAFMSTTDVARAEQLASKAAGQPAPEVIAAIQAEEKAHMALQAAIQSGNSQVIAASQNAHRASEAAAEAVMAAFGGVTPADIGAMRGSGMGWAQIAQELGIHPGSLGLTHAKGNSSQHQSDMMPATSRDVKGGRSMMHGVSPGNISGSPGMGLDHAAQNYGGWGHMGGDRGDAHGNDYGGAQGSGHGSDSGSGMSGDHGGDSGSGHGGDSGGGMGGSSGGGHGGDSGSGMGGSSGGGHGGGSDGGTGGGHR